MTQRTTLNDSDQGKKVVNSAGDEVGIVAEIENDAAYVDPDPGITDQIRAKLGWEDSDANRYALPAGSIENITDDEVRLSSEL